MKWIWILLLSLFFWSCSKKQKSSVEADSNTTEVSKDFDMDSIVDLLAVNVSNSLRDSLSKSHVVHNNHHMQPIPNANPEFSEIEANNSMVDEEGNPNIITHEGGYVDTPPVDIPDQGSLDAYYAKAFENNTQYLTDGFDFPVGKPNMRGYYIAQKYLQNRHLGDDFNANTGGNTDLGDPVYATANGIVTFSHDLEGGWGNTIRIVHRHPVGDMVETLYSHLDERYVNFGQFVKRGDLIGTIGTAHGLYPAHLHFEVRTQVNMPLGRGYSDHPAPPGYTAPTPFIRRNRPQAPRW